MDIDPIEESQHLALFAVYSKSTPEIHINISINAESYIDPLKDATVKTFYVHNPPDRLPVQLQFNEPVEEDHVVYLYWVTSFKGTSFNHRTKVLRPGASRLMKFHRVAPVSQSDIFSAHIYYEGDIEIEFYVNSGSFASPYRHMGSGWEKKSFIMDGVEYMLLSVVFSPMSYQNMSVWIENTSRSVLTYVPDISLTHDYEFDLSPLSIPYYPKTPSSYAHFLGKDLLRKTPPHISKFSSIFHIIELESILQTKDAWAHQEILLRQDDYPTRATHDHISDKATIEQHDNHQSINWRLIYDFRPIDIIPSSFYRLKLFSYFFKSSTNSTLSSFVVYPENITLDYETKLCTTIKEPWNLFRIDMDVEDQAMVFEVSSPYGLNYLDLYSHNELFPTPERSLHETIRDKVTNTLYFCMKVNKTLLINVYCFKDEIEPFNVSISIAQVDHCNEPFKKESPILIIILCCFLTLLLLCLITSFIYTIKTPPKNVYLTLSEENAENIKHMPLEIESLKDPQPVDFTKIPYVRPSSPYSYNDYMNEEDEEEDFIHKDYV